VDPDYKKLSVTKQCKILGLSRSKHYYKPREIREEKDLVDLKLILAELKDKPFYGYRKISKQLIMDNPDLTWKRVRRIMHRFGFKALFPRRNLSKARHEHKKYPYLLRGKEIRYPNQVWASDITYIKLPRGHVYLVIILDLYSRKVLSWRISNTLDSAFCVAALEEAIENFGIPAIFNTDQGCQFTSDQFISVLKGHDIRISMDGKGRALDNIYVERLWRSLKYEDIYLKDYQSVIELRTGLERYFHFYNTERFHQSHDYLTPEVMYESFLRDYNITDNKEEEVA
jgi:putative transposase